MSVLKRYLFAYITLWSLTESMPEDTYLYILYLKSLMYRRCQVNTDEKSSPSSPPPPHTDLKSSDIIWNDNCVFYNINPRFLTLRWLLRQQPALRCNALRMLLHIKRGNYLFTLILQMSYFFLLFTCCLFTNCPLIRAAVAKYVCTPAQTCTHAYVPL